MDILHATTDPTLLERLKEMLGSSARADIAVGYFFMSGFEAVADDLSKLDKVRILVGRTDRPVLDQVALGLQQTQALRTRLDAEKLVQRRQREEIAQQAVDSIADGVSSLPQELGTEAAVTKLRDMVAEGKVEVRAFRRSPLHAKAYLCWYDNHAEPGAAVVGSSNFTLSGFAGNTELNVRVTGNAEMEVLGKWFEELWNDSEDISEALETQLNRSWALAKTPPYHVYLKALYELYDTGAGPQPPLAIENLANFQIDAVSRGLTMIDAHGGCYIGDVVGLGKTYIGAELLRQLRISYPNDGPPLILCPAGLKPMWERFNEQFGLGAAIESHSIINSYTEPEFDEELGRFADAETPSYGIVLEEKYPTRGPVLVDEAHNFRNVNRRSTGLREYLDAGDHKVVLLSATPQNLGPMDIYRQLILFLDNTDHGLNIEPVNLDEYFRNAQRWLEYRADFENYQTDRAAWRRRRTEFTQPLAPREPAGPMADIERILTPIFIRRRRKDIQEIYGDTAEVNGKPVRFPEAVLDNVGYRLDKVYAKAGSFEDIQSALVRNDEGANEAKKKRSDPKHIGARYLAPLYLNPEAANKVEYRNLLRAGDRIARLMGVLLLKRLESSIEAFRSTLTALVDSNRNFREALDAGFVPVGRTASRMLAGQSFDADDLLEALEYEERRRQQSGSKKDKMVHPVGDFRVDDWKRDLDADFNLLSDILTRVKEITPEDDDKLQTLRQFLVRPDVQGGKVLIFSEAETTIEYLYRELNPDGLNPEIARLTGNTRHEAENIVTRFSPKSNPTKNRRLPGTEIRVLLATDIVSEGQNLQDCGRVLNYDLHWNPVRLIQRFGRIDRIGTEYDEINLHNMWPDLEVDAELSLTERLHRRIQSFHDLIGLDSKLLSDSEQINSSAMYRIYEEQQMPDIDDGFDEVTANQRAISTLQHIQTEDPDLWNTITELPDGIRSALRVRSTQSEASSDSYVQNVMEIEGSQAPLLALTPLEPTPFDNPRQGETLVLLEADGRQKLLRREVRPTTSVHQSRPVHCRR